MKQSSYFTFIYISTLALFFFSCSSNLDFNQVQDAKLEPIVLGNLAYFDVQANQFVTNGNEMPVSGVVMNFDIFRDSYFNNALIKAEFFFEVNNTINRAFILKTILLDSNDLPLYTISINVPAYTGVENLITKKVVFENATLDILKATKKLAFVIQLPPGSPALSETSLGSIKLRSSATAYLVLQ